MIDGLFFDTQFLKFNDVFPTKITFLKSSETCHDCFGFYSFENDESVDEVKILFEDICQTKLIPNISSIFLGNRFKNKKLVFFLIKEGFSKNESLFSNIDNGVDIKNEKIYFIAPCEQDGYALKSENNQLLWKRDDGEGNGLIQTLPVKHVIPNKHKFICVKKEYNGELVRINGDFVFSCLNENDDQLNDSFKLLSDKSNKSIDLLFDNKIDNISFRINLGKNNFEESFCNYIQYAFNQEELLQNVEGIELELNDDFDDKLIFKGEVKDNSISFNNYKFNAIFSDNKILIKGIAPGFVYQNLLNKIVIKTDSKKITSCNVKLVVYINNKPISHYIEAEICEFSKENTNSLDALLKSQDNLLKTSNRENIFEKSFKNVNFEPVGNFAKELEISLPTFLNPVEEVVQTNKKVLIFDALSETGKEITKIFARDNWDLLLCSDVDVATMENFVSEIKQTFNVNVVPFSANVNSQKDLLKLIPFILKEKGLPEAVVFKFDKMCELSQDFNLNNYQACQNETALFISSLNILIEKSSSLNKHISIVHLINKYNDFWGEFGQINQEVIIKKFNNKFIKINGILLDDKSANVGNTVLSLIEGNSFNHIANLA
ncbi:MAG: hypothetical protein MJ247_07535 [Alphaproteobacteria bacterium]|nr:hypothetical protein [Alphaproteobacteria bacterium]